MRSLLLFPLALMLAACGSWSGSWTNTVEKFSPYKMEVPQGNILTSEMLAKLKPGMTPSQVKFLLGTPLLVDPFRSNRWDYVHQVAKGGKLLENRRVTVVFEDDKLKGIEGDVTPAADPAKASAPAPAKPAAVDGEKK